MAGAAHNEIRRLRPRHQEIIRLAFQGLTNVMIGTTVGMSPAAVGCVLRSPLAQAEMARLGTLAEEKLTNIPLKARMVSELNGFGQEAFRFQRQLLQNEKIDLKLRSKIATHAMDRIIFDRGDEDDRGGSIRDVLRRLDDVADSIKDAKVLRVIDVQSSTAELGSGEVESA